MRFCKFTNSYGRPVYVNPNLLRMVERDPAFDGVTRILFSNDHSVHVQESFETVVSELAGTGGPEERKRDA